MTTVLTDEEKTRIRQEEMFRNDIRKELLPLPDPAAKKKKWRETLWAAANSNFGIWLLSAVLVSGLGKLYTDWQTSVQENTKRREVEQAEMLRKKELYDRLTLEISFRLSSTMSRLQGASARYGERTDLESHRAIIEALEPLVRPASNVTPPLFPEFNSYSGLALIAELRRHAAAGEQELLKEILAKTSGLMYEVIGEASRQNRSAKAVASRLLERMRYSRWDNGFPYTDCSNDKPFC